VTFLRPDLLIVVPAGVLLVMVALLAQWRRGRRLAEAYGGYAAAARLTGRDLQTFPGARVVALAVALIALGVAAAGAEPDQGAPPPPPTPVDLMIAVDVSHSMTGADAGGTRIQRARELVAEILEGEVADRVSVTLFADWPFELVPLTHDTGVVEFFTPWIAPELVTLRDQGTGLAAAVAAAANTWRARPREGAIPVLLVVSDGEVHGTDRAVLDAVAEVADSLSVWTAGIGSEAGAPLTVSGSEDTPLLDEAGRPVLAGFDPRLLRELAEAGGGGFHDVSDDEGRRALVSDLRRLGGEPTGIPSPVADPTSWLVLLALVLLVLDAGLDGGRLGQRRKADGAPSWLGRRRASGEHGVEGDVVALRHSGGRRGARRASVGGRRLHGQTAETVRPQSRRSA
jgi:hypothetical protein